MSVVIPCYNYGRYLAQCVETVLMQEDVKVEVVIVDDASPDGSAAVAREIAAAEPRVRVIENVVNQGHIATYNIGLAQVTGDYVVLLSADDLLAPGCLRRATALLEAHPEVAFTYGFVPDFTDQPPAAETRVRSWTIWPGHEWLEKVTRRGHNVISCPEVVMRANVLRDLGGYDGRLPHSADFYLWMLAATRGAVGRVNGPDQAYYRVHGNNMHLQQFAGVFTDLIERRRTFDLLFTEHHGRLPNLTELRTRVRHALAKDALNLACRAFDRNGADRDAKLADLMEFAAATDPQVIGSGLWRACERRRIRYDNGQGPAIVHRVSAVVDDIRGRIRWRRWRRRGV